MESSNNDETVEALQEIRDILNRSSRFISLSGFSGIWAGGTALVGAWYARGLMRDPASMYTAVNNEATAAYFDPQTNRLIVLAFIVFIVAFAGAFYFTYKKARYHGHVLWNHASQQLLLHLLFPILAGGVFCISAIYNGVPQLTVPLALAFYGMALISASRHTLSEIRYLGMFEVALGCATLFFPEFGLYTWALGFGVLHVVYGIVMRNKYDK